MREADFSYQLPASSLQSGLREQGPAASGQWTASDEPVATGRCEACVRLAYDSAKLCPVCRAELAYVMQVRALGLLGRRAEMAESRALHRWLRKQERRERLHGWGRGLRKVGAWLLQAAVVWALGYIGFQFGAMFVSWIR